jgi:predicted DsbA family dithiol-disulfide isomerase
MGVIRVTYYTDPACPKSWAAEPAFARLEMEFPDQLAITFVMGGFAREIGPGPEVAVAALDAAATSGMPVDARGWLVGAPRSSFPACIAVKAAAEQGLDGPYLRVLREGFMVDRRSLDTPEALIEAAQGVPGLDVSRFANDVRSNATVEAFGADLERTRVLLGPEPTLPAVEVEGTLVEQLSPQGLADAVRAAGGEARELPGPDAVLARGVRRATPEVAAASGLPGPRAAAALWAAALEFRVVPQAIAGGGVLWSAAAS